MSIVVDETTGIELKLVHSVEGAGRLRIWVSLLSVKGWKVKQAFKLDSRMRNIGGYFLQYGNPKKGGIEVRINFKIIERCGFTPLGVATALYEAGLTEEAAKVQPDIDLILSEAKEREAKLRLEEKMRAEEKGRAEKEEQKKRISEKIRQDEENLKKALLFFPVGGKLTETLNNKTRILGTVSQVKVDWTSIKVYFVKESGYEDSIRIRGHEIENHWCYKVVVD